MGYDAGVAVARDGGQIEVVTSLGNVYDFPGWPEQTALLSIKSLHSKTVKRIMRLSEI